MKSNDDSLSVVLPVCNDPNGLTRRISHLLEILPELTPSFDILVVDEGSTDQTEEVAHEWAVRYPQLRVVRQASPALRQGLVQLGQELTRGDVMLVLDEQTQIRPAQLRALWESRLDQRHSVADPLASVEPSLIGRLASWGWQLPRESSPPSRGAQLIWRRAPHDRRYDVHQVSQDEPLAGMAGARAPATSHPTSA